jgi:hypothetical protein
MERGLGGFEKKSCAFGTVDGLELFGFEVS